MRHRVAGRKFDRPTDHRVHMFRNLVRDLLQHGRIVTTEAKAKEIQPLAERIITLGKSGTLASRRLALQRLPDPDVVKHVFDEVAGRYKDRAGGYTRITRLGPRQGDAAPMAQLELV